jgi:hypothetical protein
LRERLKEKDRKTHRESKRERERHLRRKTTHWETDTERKYKKGASLRCASTSACDEKEEKLSVFFLTSVEC